MEQLLLSCVVTLILSAKTFLLSHLSCSHNFHLICNSRLPAACNILFSFKRHYDKSSHAVFVLIATQASLAISQIIVQCILFDIHKEVCLLSLKAANCVVVNERKCLMETVNINKCCRSNGRLIVTVAAAVSVFGMISI